MKKDYFSVNERRPVVPKDTTLENTEPTLSPFSETVQYEFLEIKQNKFLFDLFPFTIGCYEDNICHMFTVRFRWMNQIMSHHQCARL